MPAEKVEDAPAEVTDNFGNMTDTPASSTVSSASKPVKIPAAKLLKNIEVTYEKGMNLLDESTKGQIGRI